MHTALRGSLCDEQLDSADACDGTNGHILELTTEQMEMLKESRGFVLERSAADRTNKNVTERQNGAISRQKQYKLLSRLLAERPRASLNDQHQIEGTNNQSSTNPLLQYSCVVWP